MAGGLDITTFLAEYKFWNIRWKVAIDHWWPDVEQTMVSHLRETIPYDDSPFRDPDKPHLRDMIEFDVHERTRGTEARIEFWGPELAGLLEAGSPPHDIEGDPYLAMFFADGGELVTEVGVMHPGFDRIPFIENAYRQSKDEIFAAFERAVAAAVVIE